MDKMLVKEHSNFTDMFTMQTYNPIPCQVVYQYTGIYYSIYVPHGCVTVVWLRNRMS